jgi:hypothetical protein
MNRFSLPLLAGEGLGMRASQMASKASAIRANKPSPAALIHILSYLKNPMQESEFNLDGLYPQWYSTLLLVHTGDGAG